MLLGGDFNDIKERGEKHSGIALSDKKCALLHERLNACKLLDPGAICYKFTWRGAIGHGGLCVFERLDRTLRNNVWRLQFPDAYVRVLTRL